MKWRCASCGYEHTTNRQECPKCRGRVWKPAPKRDLVELSGPLKRITLKGLILAKPGKQAPTQDPNSIECGKCHMVIYRADKAFDSKAFEEAKRNHYSVSPACQE